MEELERGLWNGPRRHVPLLVLVFTQQANSARREEQRRSWLSFNWHRGPRDVDAVPWRYLYVYGQPSAG
eukprot:4692133-Prymnesium_polylepis.1